MSQHVFKTKYKNRPVMVLAGWDRPLQGFFLVVSRVNAKGREEGCVFSNLECQESHPKSFDPFRAKLQNLGIEIPDGRENCGNKRVIHEVKEGVYSRDQKY